MVDFGVCLMRLLINNLVKWVGLDGYGLYIIECVLLLVWVNVENICYLMIKCDKLGYDLVGLDDFYEFVYLFGEFGGVL